MRILRIVLVLLVLIGFPALSWVYLNSGLKWRVNAQNETTTKRTLRDFILIERDSITITPKELTGLFFVIAAPQDSLSFHHLNMVHTQFQVREDYRTLLLESNQNTTISPGDSTLMRVTCRLGCEGLHEALFSPDYSAAIVDDSLHVRGRYHLESLAEMRKLVEHLAVVLPIEKRARIELKRGNQ